MKIAPMGEVRNNFAKYLEAAEQALENAWQGQAGT